MTRPTSFSDPTIAILLRDAQPLYCEVAGEPDERTRIANVRRAQVATETLIRLFRTAAADGRTDELYPGVREFVELQMDENNGSLPKGKGGRPLADHDQFTVAVAIAMEVRKRNAIRSRQIVAVIEAIATRAGCSKEKARAAYYYWVGHHQLRRPRKASDGFELRSTERRHHLVEVEIGRRIIEERHALTRRLRNGDLPSGELRSLWFASRGAFPDFAALARLASRSLGKPSRRKLPKRRML